MLLYFFLPISVLKKVKHRVVENMNSNTADALGLSRAILCNGESMINLIEINTKVLSELFGSLNGSSAHSLGKFDNNHKKKKWDVNMLNLWHLPFLNGQC